jgi:regulator of protease activity HflC (stomatin/prohibitin superfamily)
MRKLHYLAGLFALSTLTGCATIPVGNVGVVTDTITGKVAERPIGAGFHVVGFFKQVYQFPSGIVDNITLDEFKVNTSEGQEISVDIRVQYRPKLTTDDSNAVELFKRYRKPFEGSQGLVATRWIPVIQQAAGYAFSQQGVIQVYQTRGARAAALISKILQDGLETNDVRIEGIGDDFAEIQTVAVSSIVLPDAIKTAVERKAQIEQDTLTAKQNLEKARMEAERVKIEAHADADAKFIRAQGEARARAALGISPEQYTRLEIAKMTTDAMKHSKNLMIVPDNAILDSRALINRAATTSGKEE